MLAALAYSILSKLTGIYSVWLLVVLNVLLIIPLGLLTFKYSEHIIILSSSLTGAYMVVRPFSWIFGGFPNEFVLYQMIEDRHLHTLPWSFFLYLVLILLVMVIGICYQSLYILPHSASCSVGRAVEPQSSATSSLATSKDPSTNSTTRSQQ